MAPVGLQVPESGSKISAPGRSVDPPVTSTRPSRSTAVPGAYRDADIGSAADQVPVDGSKTSTDDW